MKLTNQESEDQITCLARHSNMYTTRVFVKHCEHGWLISSSNRSTTRNSPYMPPSGSSTIGSYSTPESETPLSRQRNEAAYSSSVLACQAQLTTVLKKTRRDKRSTDEYIEQNMESVQQKLTDLEQVKDDTSLPKANGKRRRPKDYLTIQDEVHKLHGSRDERNQYKGVESVCSPHNKAVLNSLYSKTTERKGIR